MRTVALFLMVLAWCSFGAMPGSAAVASVTEAAVTGTIARPVALVGGHDHAAGMARDERRDVTGGCPHGSGMLHCGFCPACLATVPMSAARETAIILSRYPPPERGRSLSPAGFAPLLPPPRS